MQYSDKVLDHFMNPRNTGEIPDADGIGTIGSEQCGDMIRVWIKVSDDEHLTDIKYKVFGCPAAIACCSMMTELAVGKHVDDAWELMDEQVADALGGLPTQKYHCSNLAASTLHKAIMNYAFKDPAKSDFFNITVLVNDISSENLKSEHGLSLWIRYGGKQILFDTGQSNLIIKNAKKLACNIEEADAIVISHGHYDHTGGLSLISKIASNAKIYMHPAASEPKFSKKKSSVKSIGIPDYTIEILEKNQCVWTTKPCQLFPGISVTGPIPRIYDYENNGAGFYTDKSCKKKDELWDDQAVYIESTKGLVVILGCAHSGVVNTLDYISTLTRQNKIYAVIGGMHLINAGQKRIANTIEAFKKYDIQKIIPMHCTGSKAMEELKKAFGKKYMNLNAGENITFNDD